MSSLDSYAKDFLEETLSDTQAGNNSQEDVFTERFYGYLVAAEECVDPNVCFFKKPGMKVNAYEHREDTDTLVLFVSIFDAVHHLKNVTKKNLEDAFKRGKKFYEKCVGGLYETIEESQDAFSLAHLIYHERENWRRVKIYVLTNGKAVNEIPQDDEYKGTTISYHLWDIERLFQFENQGAAPEALKINFVEEFGEPLQCLRTPDSNEVYNSYIAVLPGKTLSKIYEKWGQRLIERNVRSYLQATGKVNKGIRDTLNSEPHMFMAYNNGISTTAEGARFDNSNDTGQVVNLVELTGWQIVNGGQTTASLYMGAKKADLSSVYVQMKLTILADQSQADEVVSKISMYANSQTKINISDFNSNDKYHVALERHSRSIWAPNKDFRGKSTTKWFYERARGQYMVEANRQPTPKKKKEFIAQHPSKQKLVKTAVAKYEMSWRQKPHLVSRGGETNFVHFTGLVNKEMADREPDQDYFKEMVAKAILFKACDDVVKRLNYPGYKANVVTYSIALLSHLTNQNLDLMKIWQRQEIDEKTKYVLTEIAQIVWDHITNPTTKGTNVTQWCKREECWELLKKRNTLVTHITEIVAASKEEDE